MPSIRHPDSIAATDTDPGQHRRRDEALVHGLRHERNHRARAARRPRRPEAGAPARALRHADDGPGVEPRGYRKCAKIVGEVMGNYHPTATPRSTTRSSAWRRTSTCATRWSTARATSARSTATRRRRCATPRRASRRSAEAMMDGSRQGDRRLRPQLRRDHRRADRPAGDVPEPAGQRLGRHRRRHGDEHPAAQHARGDRRRDRASSSSRTAAAPSDALPQRLLQVRFPGPDFPTGGIIVGRAGHLPGLQRPAAARRSCAPRPTIEENKKGDRVSIVVTEIPTRSTRRA